MEIKFIDVVLENYIFDTISRTQTRQSMENFETTPSQMAKENGK